MTDAQDRALSVREISRLFDIAGREPDVIANLNAGMDQLRAVQAAKQALTTLSPAEVRAAIAYRRVRPGGTGAADGAQGAGELS